MRSTFYGLEIAKTGLFISQNQLDITSHNISNVDTEGYTRQRLSTAAIPAAGGNTFIAIDKTGTSGQGVEPIYVEQVRNPFLDYQYRIENSTTTNWQTKEQYFGYVESLFNNELDDIVSANGISAIFSGFYDSLQELSKGPEKTEMRENVLQQAQNVTSTMNYYYGRLIEQQGAVNESIKVTADEINSLAQKISQLNDQIYGYELSGARANDLRDQRTLLLDTLAGLADVNIYEDVNSQLIVELDGRQLVRHSSYKQLSTVDNIPNPLDGGVSSVVGVYWTDNEGNPTTNQVTFEDGAMRGYLDVRDGDSKENVGIPYVVQELNALCQKIAKDMNDVHMQGYTIPVSDTADSLTGIQFFYADIDPVTGEPDYSTITAENFRVGTEILNDVANIATSDMPIEHGASNEQMGNNKIILAMCEVVTQKNSAGIADNIDSEYRALLSDIGIRMDSIIKTASSQNVMRSHVDQQRKSVSDVSLDEEMTNVIRYGYAYQAASRAITAVDEMLDVLINKMGLVGR